MKKFWSIVGTIFLIFSIIVLIFCIYVAVRTKQTGQDMYILGYKPYMISTGSMEPTLKVRGLVVIKEIPYENIKVDDIISFVPEEMPDKSVCHRVVEITDEGFVTKGDNNFKNDMGLVTKDEYKGKLVFHSNIYANAYYVVTDSNPIVLVVLFSVLIIGIVLAVVAIRILRKEKELEEEPKKEKKSE